MGEPEGTLAPEASEEIWFGAYLLTVSLLFVWLRVSMPLLSFQMLEMFPALSRVMAFLLRYCSAVMTAPLAVRMEMMFPVVRSNCLDEPSLETTLAVFASPAGMGSPFGPMYWTREKLVLEVPPEAPEEPSPPFWLGKGMMVPEGFMRVILPSLSKDALASMGASQ